MHTRRVISLLTLLSFLPLAMGCSKLSTVPISSNPGADSEVVSLDEPIRIKGYKTPPDTVHEWDGYVRQVGDNLEFYEVNWKSGRPAPMRPPSFSLARADVVSLTVKQKDGGRTAAVLVVVGIVVVMSIAVTVAMVNEAKEPILAGRAP